MSLCRGYTVYEQNPRGSSLSSAERSLLHTLSSTLDTFSACKHVPSSSVLNSFILHSFRGERAGKHLAFSRRRPEPPNLQMPSRKEQLAIETLQPWRLCKAPCKPEAQARDDEELLSCLAEPWPDLIRNATPQSEVLSFYCKHPNKIPICRHLSSRVLNAFARLQTS